jgi:hypothetical protein
MSPIVRENITTVEVKMDAANIDFFDIRFSDLIAQPTRNGQEAASVGSAEGIQARWRCAGRCKGPRGPYAVAIGKAAPEAAIIRVQL